MHRTDTLTVVLGLGAAIACFACGPNRAQWMARAKSEQARAATQSFGDVAAVRQQARAASESLAEIRSVVPALAPQVALLTGALDDIANSQTDEAFSTAVLGMCEPDREEAATTVGDILLVATAKAKRNPRSMQPQDAQAIAYFSGLGSTLANLPDKCDQVAQALAQESAAEQRAEAEHQTNVNRALIAAEVLFAGAVIATRPPPP